jgi:nitrate/TMAO reductase-like tetraheme cytochrome c subunit
MVEVALANKPPPARQNRLRALFRKYWLLGSILVGGGVLGMAAFGTWITVIEHTNHTEFCINCHIMRDTVYQEFKESSHFKNEHGFHASCPDCHVPQYSWWEELKAKVGTAGELYAFFFQGMSNVENFEKERPKLAKEVWAKFYATNARECRHCHDYNNMVFDQQKPSARVSHQTALKTDQNCIDCHRAITHKKVWADAPAPADSTDFDVN